MNILFDINHPAHVHLFRITISRLKSLGHRIIVIAREKEVTTQLLDQYGLDYILLTKAGKGLLGLALELIAKQTKLIPVFIKNKIDLCVSVTGASSIHIAKLFGIRYIIFHDSESAEIQNAITYPFADAIYTPDVYRLDHGKKHIRYAGYHELAYLHPDSFKPNPETLRELNLSEQEPFFVLRFVSWQASHDVGRFGFNLEEKQKVISFLNEHGKVFITSEKPLEEELEKYRIRLSPEKLHDMLFYATMLVTDSQTVTTEAAVLGTPAVRYNSFVGPNDMGNFIDLEKTYDLIYSFNKFDQALHMIKTLVQKTDLKNKWQQKRKKLLEHKINVADWMTKTVVEQVTESSTHNP